jgi:hypothetical protein
MGHRSHFHRHFVEIDSVLQQTIDDGPKGSAELAYGYMAEVEISAAVG